MAQPTQQSIEDLYRSIRRERNRLRDEDDRTRGNFVQHGNLMYQIKGMDISLSQFEKWFESNHLSVPTYDN